MKAIKFHFKAEYTSIITGKTVSKEGVIIASDEYGVISAAWDSISREKDYKSGSFKLNAIEKYDPEKHNPINKAKETESDEKKDDLFIYSLIQFNSSEAGKSDYDSMEKALAQAKEKYDLDEDELCDLENGESVDIGEHSLCIISGPLN